MLILLNVPKHGGMRSVITNLPDIDPPKQLKTGISSKESSRKPNGNFSSVGKDIKGSGTIIDSMTKFIKLH